MLLSRRGLIGALLAAPVIIRTPGLLMPVKPINPYDAELDWYLAAAQYVKEHPVEFTINGNFQTITELSPNTDYSFQVVAIDEALKSTWDKSKLAIHPTVYHIEYHKT